jgi:hypothetical protein
MYSPRVFKTKQKKLTVSSIIASNSAEELKLSGTVTMGLTCTKTTKSFSGLMVFSTAQ